AFSNSGSLDAASLRLDHRLSSKWNVFSRYNYSPSEIVPRGRGLALSQLLPARIVISTLTLGATGATFWGANDLRFNYSRTTGGGVARLDSFNGATPPATLPIPSSVSSTGSFTLEIFSLTNG